jgi:hypothetical protein
MVEIQEAQEEITIENVIKQMMERIQRLEATVGYIIHTQKIASPIVKEDEAGED